MRKLAVITTHPIQYNAPLFKMLTERKNIDIKIFYTWSQSIIGKKFDPGFGHQIEWDIPLLEGYEYAFVNNISTTPGSHHYKGINTPTLIKEIQEWGANAVLVYGWNFKSHWAAIRFFYRKIPVFFRGDSTLLDDKKGLKHLLRRTVLRYVYAHINIALYAGEANKVYFKSIGLNEGQLIFMPHAVDNARFHLNKGSTNIAIELKNELGIEPTEIVFLFVGKFEIKKNPDLLAKAFIDSNLTNAHLIFVGNGILERDLSNKYGQYKNIHFLGFQNQSAMPAIYTMCEVFVLPSSGPGETWGLAINEAMAAGKAIIASDACGAAYDIVKNNENGFTFPKNDLETLKSKILYFVENRSEVKRMGNNSKKIIHAYSYVNDCIALEETVKNVCSV